MTQQYKQCISRHAIYNEDLTVSIRSADAFPSTHLTLKTPKIDDDVIIYRWFNGLRFVHEKGSTRSGIGFFAASTFQRRRSWLEIIRRVALVLIVAIIMIMMQRRPPEPGF